MLMKRATRISSSRQRATCREKFAAKPYGLALFVTTASGSRDVDASAGGFVAGLERLQSLT